MSAFMSPNSSWDEPSELDPQNIGKMWDEAMPGIRMHRNLDPGEASSPYLDPAKVGPMNIMGSDTRGPLVMVKNSKHINPNDMSAAEKAFIADRNEVSERNASNKKSFDDIYGLQREMEEQLVRDGHSRATADMASNRAREWSRISPLNLSEKFLEKELGYKYEDILELRRHGNKSAHGMWLQQRFAHDMAGLEVLGGYAETGELSMSPGAWNIGMYEPGYSRYITQQQQARFAKDIFDIGHVYSVEGESAPFNPGSYTRVRIVHDTKFPEEMLSVSRLRKMAESRLGDLRRLSHLEEIGLAWPVSWVNRYASGKRANTLVEQEDMSSFLLSLWREGGGEDDNNSISLDWASKDHDVVAIADEASASERSPSGLQGSYAREGEMSASEQVASYTVPEGYYKRRLEEYKADFDKAFVYNGVDKAGEDIPLKKGQLASTEFMKSYKQAVSGEIATVMPIGGRSQSEIDAFLSTAGGGDKIQAGYGKEWTDLRSRKVESFSDILLRGFNTSAIGSMEQMASKAGSRAMAEKVFDVYFSRAEGEDAFNAFTEAGTFLGKTKSGFVPPTSARAKVFKSTSYESVDRLVSETLDTRGDIGQVRRTFDQRKDTYGVVWQSGDDAFFAHEQSPVEQDIGLKRIKSMADAAEENRLIGSAGAEHQSILERIYSQTDSDYGLISRYKQVAIDTGEGFFTKYVDILNPGSTSLSHSEVSAHRASVLKRYEEDAMRFSQANRSSIPIANVEQSMFSKASEWFHGRSDKTKSMMVGGLIASAALLMVGATFKKKNPTSQEDAMGSDYAMSTEDQRIFHGRHVSRPTARITPQYNNVRGYTTNIDIMSSGAKGMNHEDLARVMNRHAQMVLGTDSGKISMDINDSSDKSDDRDKQRRYAKMLRA